MEGQERAAARAAVNTLVNRINIVEGASIVMSKFVKVNEKIAEGVTKGFTGMCDGVVSGFNKMTEGVVRGYIAIEDKFVGAFLAREGESVEDAKKRLTGAEQEKANERD